MKISIIGGGFYGCYFALKLSKHHKVTIFEKNKSILNEAARYNQYRLHQGYHYPRSPETIKQTFYGYQKFTEQFKKYIFFPKNNFYLIHKNSYVNFDKYLQMFSKDFNYSITNPKNINFLKDPQQYLGAINTSEGVILLNKLIPKIKLDLKKKCTINLNSLVTEINPDSTEFIANNRKHKCDCIINTTYLDPNMGLKNTNNFNLKYELAVLLIPDKKIKNIPGITIMDGKFVSLYPRDKASFSISSVKHTPINKFFNKSKISTVLEKIKETKFQNKIKKKIINDFNNYINLKIDLKKTKIEYAIKAKIKNDKNDVRISYVKYNNKVISLLPGKLDAAPAILDKIQLYIKKI